jgi:hypothetical protein
MAPEAGQQRYILTLLVEGGWPDESLVPRPEALQQELEAVFQSPVTVRASPAAQNPGAHTQRYYELQASPALTPETLKDMVVVGIERIGADAFSGLEVDVVLANSTGTNVARGTAKPQPR